MNREDSVYVALPDKDKFKLIKRHIKRVNDDIEDVRERLHILKQKKMTYKNALQELKQSLPNGALKTEVNLKITDVNNEQSELSTHLW